MIKICYQIFILLLFAGLVIAQSQSDIDKILELKKQMEKMDLSDSEKLDAQTIESLNTFKDNTDSLKLVENLDETESGSIKKINRQKVDFSPRKP